MASVGIALAAGRWALPRLVPSRVGEPPSTGSPSMVVPSITAGEWPEPAAGEAPAGHSSGESTHAERAVPEQDKGAQGRANVEVRARWGRFGRRAHLEVHEEEVLAYGGTLREVDARAAGESADGRMVDIACAKKGQAGVNTRDQRPWWRGLRQAVFTRGAKHGELMLQDVSAALAALGEVPPLEQVEPFAQCSLGARARGCGVTTLSGRALLATRRDACSAVAGFIASVIPNRARTGSLTTLGGGVATGGSSDCGGGRRRRRCGQSSGAQGKRSLRNERLVDDARGWA
eukprot:scaffold13584_cov30-Tisochrysis_lutea.AAC.2